MDVEKIQLGFKRSGANYCLFDVAYVVLQNEVMCEAYVSAEANDDVDALAIQVNIACCSGLMCRVEDACIGTVFICIFVPLDKDDYTIKYYKFINN